MPVRRVPSFSSRPGFPAGLRVLVVDSNNRSRKEAEQLLGQCNYEVKVCSNCSDAAKLLNGSEAPMDVVLAEASTILPKSTEASKLLALTGSSRISLVLMAAQPSPGDIVLAIKNGAAEFLEMPLSSLKLQNLWQHTVRKMMTKVKSTVWTFKDAKDPFDCKRSASCPVVKLESGCEGGIDKPSPILLSATMADGNGAGDGMQMHSSFSTSQLDVSDCSERSEHSWEPAFDTICSTEDKSKQRKQPRQLASASVLQRRPLAIKPHTLSKAPSAPVLNSTPISTPAPSPTPPPAAALHKNGPQVRGLGPLAPGMVWGMPMNPLARAPGITPPMLPSPGTTPSMPWTVMGPGTFPGAMCPLMGAMPLNALPFGTCPPMGMPPMPMPPMNLLPSVAETCFNPSPVHAGSLAHTCTNEDMMAVDNLSKAEAEPISDQKLADENLLPAQMPFMLPQMEDNMALDKMFEGAADSFLTSSSTFSSSEDEFCADIGSMMHSDSYNVLPSLDLLMMEDNCSSCAGMDNPIGLNLKKSDSLLNMISANLLMTSS